jgi:glycerophosphoryl diester phosphodiesterase
MAERRFSLDLSSPLVVAHRGASRDRPENTFPAFEAAIAAGAHAVEFDVRMSRDGHAVVMHDASVRRTTGADGLVRDLTLAELKRLSAGPAVGASGGDRAEIPTLSETLEFLSGRVAVDVEIKNLPGEPDHDPDHEAAVEATLRALDDVAFVGAVLISSFNPRSLARAVELEPDVPTGFLALEAMPIDDAVALARGGNHPWVLPAAGAVLAGGPSAVDLAHRTGLRLGTWIVDDVDDAARLAAWGVDAVATNDPVHVVPAIRARHTRGG